MDALRKREESVEIKAAAWMHKCRSSVWPQFIHTNTFPVLSLPCLPQMTSHGLFVLKAAKHVVYSDLKNPHLAFSIYFQALYNLQALMRGKAKGKVKRNTINNPIPCLEKLCSREKWTQARKNLALLGCKQDRWVRVWGAGAAPGLGEGTYCQHRVCLGGRGAEECSAPKPVFVVACCYMGQCALLGCCLRPWEVAWVVMKNIKLQTFLMFLPI